MLSSNHVFTQNFQVIQYHHDTNVHGHFLRWYVYNDLYLIYYLLKGLFLVYVIVMCVYYNHYSSLLNKNGEICDKFVWTFLRVKKGIEEQKLFTFLLA